MPERKTPTGRPRDHDIDQRIHTATCDLLTEQSYGALSFEAVARRAGTSKPSLYRRWPNKADLVIDVLAGAAPRLLEIPGTDPLDTLARTAAGFVSALAASTFGPTILALHAEARRDPQLAEHLQTHYLMPRADTVNGLIERAADAGMIADGLDTNTVRDLVFGPLVYRLLVVGVPMTKEESLRLAAAAIRGIAR
ncbi:MAG: TetR/AcrR family transcriptional regulator [Rhodococcus sp.]|nr:TetR/AcrR family transcriptional regulator [Rhodococcus sp. (in: high G+C Gram-positive bacteria)]